MTFTFTFHLAAFPYLVSPSSFSFSTSGIEPRSHTLQAHSLPSEPPGKPSASQPHLYSHWVLVTVDSKAVQGLEWVQYCRWVIVVLFKLGKSDLKLADQCIHIYIYFFFPHCIHLTWGIGRFLLGTYKFWTSSRPLSTSSFFSLFFLFLFPPSLLHFPIPLFLDCFGFCCSSHIYWINSILFPTFFSFIFISWRLITLQYCSGFCHTLTWISHGFACIPHLSNFWSSKIIIFYIATYI